MKLHGIPPESTTLPSTLPCNLPGGAIGALLIHGFTGSPRDLAGLGRLLNARGMTVSIPRLPGHGTNGRDFLQTGWRDWLRSALDAYLDLRARCDTIHLVGFSMGGLIAVLIASRFPIGRLALLAPALRVRNPLLPVSPFLRLLLRRMRWPNKAEQDMSDPDNAVLAREYWQWRYAAQSASLLRLQRKARRALHAVTAETLTLLGQEDRVIPRSVIRLIEGRIASTRNRHLILPNASHVILAGSDGEQAADEVIRWLADDRRD